MVASQREDGAVGGSGKANFAHLVGFQVRTCFVSSCFSRSASKTSGSDGHIALVRQDLEPGDERAELLCNFTALLRVPSIHTAEFKNNAALP